MSFQTPVHFILRLSPPMCKSATEMKVILKIISTKKDEQKVVNWLKSIQDVSSLLNVKI